MNDEITKRAAKQVNVYTALLEDQIDTIEQKQETIRMMREKIYKMFRDLQEAKTRIDELEKDKLDLENILIDTIMPKEEVLVDYGWVSTNGYKVGEEINVMGVGSGGKSVITKSGVNND